MKKSTLKKEVKFLQDENLELKQNINTLQSVFYNKELSDIIRDLVKNSCVTFQDAYIYLMVSTDPGRDAEIIKELANAGVSKKEIIRILGNIDQIISDFEKLQNPIRLNDLKKSLRSRVLENICIRSWNTILHFNGDHFEAWYLKEGYIYINPNQYSKKDPDGISFLTHKELFSLYKASI